MRSHSCFYIDCVCLFFVFLWAKCKRQFSVPFMSCSCSRVDHVCVFLFSWFEQINDDDDDTSVYTMDVMRCRSIGCTMLKLHRSYLWIFTSIHTRTYSIYAAYIQLRNHCSDNCSIESANWRHFLIMDSAPYTLIWPRMGLVQKPYTRV